MEERRHRKEAGEARKVPRQGFCLDLLAEVELRVGLEGGLGLLAGPDEGQGSEPQGALEIEVPSQLLRNEGEEEFPLEPSREEVDPASPELAGTRARQGELEPFLLDEAVHLVEQT